MYSLIICTRRLAVFACILSLLLLMNCDSGSSKKKSVNNDKLIVAGFTYNGTDNDWWIKAFSFDGTEDTTHWNKIIDSGYGYDAVYSLAVDSQSNLYAAGYNTDTGGSKNEWWIKKFDALGTEDTTWNKTVSSTGDARVSSIVIDRNDNVYAVGYVTNTRRDYMIKKYSSAGVEDTANWNMTVVSDGYDDEATSVAVDSDDNVYVTGYSNGNLWIRKFDPSGAEDTVNWNKSIAGGDWPNKIAIDKEGNVYVSGNTDTLDWFIKKFDSNGVEDTGNWNKIIDGPNSGYDSVQSLAFDSLNNVYVVGSVNTAAGGNDWWLKKFSSDGVEDTAGWNKVFNGGDDDVATDIVIDGSDNIYIVGMTNASSNNNWWLKKFSAGGTEDTTNWNKIIDGSAHGIDYAFTAVIMP